MRILIKRAVRRLALFVLLLIVPMVAAGVSAVESPPAAGFYMNGQDPASVRVSEYLLDNGFVAVEDQAAIAELVRLGELDCGAVFPEDFGNRLAEGDLEESIVFYTAPSSFSPELYRNHVAAAVFRERASYISAALFEGTEVPRDAVMAEYETMFADGYAFSFEVETVSGTAMPEDGKTRALVMGVSAILLFTVLFVLCAENVESSFKQILPRIGLRSSVKAVLIPETLLNVVFAAAACGIGVAAAGFPKLILPIVLHSLLLCGTGLILVSVLQSAKRVYALLPVLVVGSVALCPIYTDLALVIPAAAVIRKILPAYWLWLIAEAPGLWIPLSVAVLAAGLLSVIAVGNRKLLRGHR